MKTYLLATILAVCALGAGPVLAGADEDTTPAPTPASADTQVLELEKMCEANADARAARHAATTLYERLGKDEGVHRLTREIVRLHLQNEQIGHMFADLDNDLVAERVAEFMISGMGGPAVYQDRPSLPDSHRRLELTNSDFVSAGGDVIQAMKNLEYGQDEIDEVVCALVGLRSMVVLADDTKAAAHH
jgi:hemoglobin